ncbi:hypothetical protein J4422_03110 [Candidatus Pacearchaeota archaeon]|nr:hypothetical protein [Candidatus Pacearchaeota archaeon]
MRLIGAETEVIWKLSSAYEACTLSACDPVSVPVGGTSRKGAFSHMFYDCTDPEKEGIEIMRQRIKDGRDDILAHLRIHDNLLSGFYSVDDALKTENRERIVEEGRRIFENLENYGKHVGEHSVRFAEKAFLYYPTCLSGHYFVPKGAGVIMEKVFNPQQNEEGLKEEITNGIIALENFPLFSLNDELRVLRMYEGYDSGEGSFGTSFRGRLELTRLLLERAGFYHQEAVSR